MSNEKQAASRTYFLLNDSNGDLLGYTTVSSKEIKIDTELASNSLLKKLKARGGIIKTHLIGQIGKNFNINNNPINLKDLLAEAYGIIYEAQDLIGGKVITLECENIEKLVQYYERHGFKKIPVINDTNTDLITMYIVATRE
ncbi:acetyltransferase [Marinomonas sp. CT5]|nr:acetyltransferase [Marinomonas sp. CT5]